MNFFVSDLDKTLLRSDLTLSSFTKEIWNSFHKPLTIATARSYTGVQKLIGDLKLTKPLILLDGAMIADPNGNIIKVNALDEDLSNEMIASIEKEFDERPLIVGLDGKSEKFLYPRKLNIYQKELLENYQNDNRVLNIEKLKALKHNLKIVYLGQKDLLEQIEQRAKTFECETKLSKDPYQNCYFLTILHPKGDKSHALRVLEEIEEIDPQEVSVFGDSLNDIGMFQWAGKAIAVQNALDEVKKKADIVLEHTNDEDGVARYLAKI